MELGYTPREIAARYVEAGKSKADRGTGQMVLLGVLAGLLIGVGCAATNTAVYGIPDVWTARTVCALLFPFGLGMVVILGLELFTGNSLMLISVLEKRCTPAKLLHNWVIVYLANLAGSLLAAAGCSYFGQLNYSGGQLALYTMRVAAGKCALPFGNALVLGIFCNILVCLGVLMSMSAKDTSGRVFGAYLPVCYFVLCGFEHCVANMYYIPAGLMAKSIPAYAQLAAEAGLDLSGLTVSGFVWGNLLPVTLGNLIGGCLLALVVWYCSLRKEK